MSPLLGGAVAVMLAACGGGGGSSAPNVGAAEPDVEDIVIEQTTTDLSKPVELGAALPDFGDFIAIEQQSITLSEAARVGTVSVVRSGQAEDKASVTYQFKAGTATLNEDFRGNDGSLSWAAGETGAKTIRFTVDSDLEVEAQEDFYVQLTSIEAQESLGVNDQVHISITDAGCSENLPTDISSDTTLSEPCYRLQETATVSGLAQLKIDAGTTVIADQGTSIQFTDQASIAMSGQAGLPAIVKGASAAAGSWDGVLLNSSSALHHIEYAEVSNAVNGFNLINGSLATFDNNVLSKHSKAGISIPLGAASLIGANNVFNDSINGIELAGNSVAEGETVLLPGQSTHYSLDRALIVRGTLRLLPGLDLRLHAGAQILVSSTGAINSVGTQEQPIVVQGLKPQIGYWNGIQYLSSTSEDNQYEYTTIAHGGGDPARPGNIIVDGLHSRISMQHCALTHSEGYGIVYDAVAFQVDLQDVTFAQNKRGEQSL